MRKNPAGYDEWIIECSGRLVYMNCGIVGIGPEENAEPSEGYDGGMEGFGYGIKNPWTPGERRELADEMIKRWERFATK